MKKLCFGGSFNPIHHAHLVCARAAGDAGGFDRIVLIPSRQPPHKPDAPDMASPDDRLAMCRLAAAESTGFEVDDLELARTGPSYTIDTARELRRRGWNEIHWLIGADMLMDLPRWHEPQALLEEVRFVVMARPGWTMDWHRLPPSFHRLQEAIVEAPLIEISATDIRRRVRAGLPIDRFVPPSVEAYIRDRALYRDVTRV